MTEPLISLEDQEKILLVAEGLIAEPDSWVRGQWKCPAIKPGGMEQKRDANNQPLFQYCIEGAVNQATVNVLGEERARELGVYVANGHGTSWGETYINGRKPTQLLGLNPVSRKLFGRAAMNYNDAHDSTHDGVLRILRTRFQEVRAKLKERSRT